MAIRTIDISVLTGETGSLFETVAILSKRARQISAKGKAELDEKLSYFEGFGSEIEDTRMTEEQVRTSVDYEKRAKPPEVAINEMMNREIYFRNPNEEETL